MIKRKLNVFLIYPTYFGDINKFVTSIPLNIGYIAAYSHKIVGSECNFYLLNNVEELIEKTKEIRPDVLGLSCYIWNTNLAIWAARKIKAQFSNCIVVAGGPSIDISAPEQEEFISRFGGACDFLVPNEGELGFANLLQTLLSSNAQAIPVPINGVISFRDGERIAGLDVGVNLEDIPSPYLCGFLDHFMENQLMPLIQTSRNCPYRCSYCVSGKDNNKLKTFSLDIIREELEYVARSYRNYPHIELFVVDLNFGINAQDADVAELIYKTSRKFSYPNEARFYYNKKLDENMKKIIDTMSPINTDTFKVPFQSTNERVLADAGRKNINEKDIDEIMEWCESRDHLVSSELIFGLPHETKDSFIEAVDFCESKQIWPHIHNLMLLPGSELLRKSVISNYKIETKYRPPYVESYTKIGDEFVSEYEEVVISSVDFDFNDFISIRKISLMCYVFYDFGYFRRPLDFIRSRGWKSSDIFLEILDVAAPIGEDQHRFIKDFLSSVNNELFETQEELFAYMEKMYERGKEYLSRINTLYMSRLVFEENFIAGWFVERMKGRLNNEDMEVLLDLIKISEYEWVDLDDLVPEKSIKVSKATLAYLTKSPDITAVASHSLEIRLQLTKMQIQQLASFINSHGGEDNIFYKLCGYMRDDNLKYRLNVID